MKTFANLIYKKAIDYAGKKQSTKFLAFISFIESFIFPLPTDIFLIPMIIAKKKKIFIFNNFNNNFFCSWRNDWIFYWLLFLGHITTILHKTLSRI